MIINIGISRKMLLNGLAALVALPLFAYIYSYTPLNEYNDAEKEPAKISFKVYFEEPTEIQIFFSDSIKAKTAFTESNSLKYTVGAKSKLTEVEIQLPRVINLNCLRIDFGSKPDLRMGISLITIKDNGIISHITPQRLSKAFPLSHDIGSPEIKQGLFFFTTLGGDPYLAVDKLFAAGKEKPVWPESISSASWVAALISIILLFIVLLVLSRKSTPSTYRFYPILLIIMTAFLLILPGLGLMYDIDKNWVAEKRLPVEKPVWQSNELFSYPSKYNQYINDNYGYRKWSIYSYNYIVYKIFGQSPRPQNIFLGPDGWMFYIQEASLLQEKFFSENKLMTIAKNIEKRTQWCEKRGIRYYVMITPEKMNLYSEFFPGFDTSRHVVQKAEGLQEYLEKNSNCRIIYPKDRLNKEKSIQKNPLFYKQDTHWNDLGAFFGYLELAERIKQDFPALIPLSLDQFELAYKKINKKNIADMIGVDTALVSEPTLTLKGMAESELKSTYKYKADEYAEISIYTHSDTSRPRILVFHDSFGKYLIPYISETFGYSVFVFGNYVDEALIEEHKPDIVIYQLAMGRMNNLMKF